MKEIHVIVFLAFLTVIAAEDEIPTECPLREKDNITTTHLAHETDCTKFYKCNWGKGVLQDCPFFDEYRRLHFNRSVQVCDWPALAGCAECPENNGNYPSSKISHEKDNCKLYYECIDGEKKLRECPKGLCFSRTCQRCVRDRKNGKCDDDCDLCENNERKSHECQDDRYYVCIDCDWVLRFCDTGCLFDRKTKTCRNSKGVECKSLGY